MRKPIICCALSWLVLVAALSGHAWAEESPRDIVEAYRVWKLTEALDLSEEQMPVFFAKLQKAEDSAVEFRQAQREALRDMAHLLEKKDADEAELARALDRYEEMLRKHREDTARLRSDATSMLSVRQRCQHAVFEERFRNELREMITRVREMRGANRPDEGDRFGEPGDRGGFGEREGGERMGERSGGSGGSGKRGR